jgi:ABC-type nitrate/sulfonate/bicarbonate transport system substrate-binding protein
MNSKHWLVLLLSLSLFLFACTGCRGGATGTEYPQKVSIATSKNPWSALTIIAHKKGFFKEQGLEVDLQYVQAAKLAMDALISGSTQFSNVVETNVAFLGFTGSKDISIIATHCEAHDGAIIARKDAKIQTPKDLEGKKLGVLQGTTSQIFADRFIEKYSLKGVQIVNLTTVAIQSSVLSKDIDAGSIWQPFIYNVHKQLGDNAVIFADSDVYVGYFNLAVQRSWAKSNPKLVEKALLAHIKAEEFAKSNQDEAIALVAEEIGIDKAALSQFWNQYVYRVQVKPDLAREIAQEGDWIKNTQPQHKGQPVPAYDWAIDDSYLRSVASDRVAK